MRHLVPIRTKIGLHAMPEVVGDFDETVHVMESSAFEAARIWLTIGRQDGSKTFAHLTLEQAKQIGEQLIYLSENHRKG